MDCILQVEVLHELCDVGGIGVHLVAGLGLRRTAVSAPVVRDDAIAAREEEQHLRVPIVG
jgi:hypothetical protein